MLNTTGLIHVHSTYSYDGKESLVNLKQFLVTHGINFCCLTEHTDFLTKEKAESMVKEAKALSDENFIFIPGFEVPYKEAHILLIGSEVFLGQTADGGLLREWSQQSALTVLAHPVRNKFIVDELILEVIDGVEVWNQQYEGKIVPRPKSIRLLETLKLKKSQLLATGGTDFHRQEHFGAPIYQIGVEQLSAGAILKKLKSGDYTFGNDKLKVSSQGTWPGRGAKDYWQSVLSVAIISLGKGTNKTLARFGFRLPRFLKQIVRRKI